MRRQTGPVFSPMPPDPRATLSGERGIDSVLFRIETLGVIPPHEAANERPGSGIIDLREVLASGAAAARARVQHGGDLLAIYSASRSPAPLPEPFPWRRALAVSAASLAVSVAATLALWLV
jgi:hypothetical protein